MGEAKWEKIAAATGIVAIVLYGVIQVLVGNPPAGDATGGEILEWATDKRDAILQGAYLAGLATVLLIWWVGSLRSYLRSAEGGTGRLSAVVFGAGIVMLALSAITAALSAVMVVRLPGAGDAAMTQMLFDGMNALYATAWFPLAAAVGAAAVITMRSRAFPMWFGLAGYAAMIVFLLAGLGLTTATGVFAANGGVGYLAYAVSALWVVVASVLMIQRIGRE